MSAADLANLVEMGFDHQRAGLAIQASSNLEQALDWLKNNQDRSIGELTAAQAAVTSASAAATASVEAAAGRNSVSAEALSLLCLECGKRLPSVELANTHGSKTGHTNFEESTEQFIAMSPEEKAARLAELQEKSRIRKAEQAKTEMNEAREREQLRRKVTKETQDAQEESIKKNHLKHAAEVKQQKIDDAAHRKKVLEKLRIQRQEQAERDEAERAARRGEEPAPEPVRSFDPSASVTATPDSVRLQLRFPDGPPLIKTVAKTTTLADLAAVAESERGVSVGKLSLMPTRTIFGPEDFDKTLVQAGVAGSAVFILN